MIKEYDLFHIGTKFENFVNLQSLAEKLVPDLKKAKFKLIEDAPVQGLQFPPVYKKIAEKGDVRIELNFSANSINTIGQSPKKVLAIFKDLINFIEKQGHDINQTVEFFELIVNVTAKTKMPPVELFKKNISFNFKDIESKSEFVPIAIKYSNALHGKKEELIDFTIQPKITNPSELLLMVLVYRQKSKDNLFEFCKNVEKKLTAVLSMVGG